MQDRTTRTSIARNAFSLAEVVIALAIAALGFVSLLGLLPQGLQMSRQAANMGAQSRIVQQISSELNATPWDKIPWAGGYGAPRFFDDQGLEIESSELSQNPMALTYVASVFVPTGTGVESKQMTLPMFSAPNNQIVQETYLRRVRVYVATTANANFSFNSAPANSVFFTTLVLVKGGTETIP